MDSAGSDRPQWRTAVVGRELDLYKVEIAALSETRLAEEGFLKEVGAGYTFFWSRRKKEERREAEVGFVIKSHLFSKLSGLPKGINDCLMTPRLHLSGKSHATIVSVCAPTMTNPDEVKDKFYDDLDTVISAAPRTDKFIPPRGYQCQSGHRSPNLGRSDWNWRSWEVQQQWPPPFKEMCRAWTIDHQHSRPSTNSQKDIMDAPSLQTLASHWLCHSAKEGQTGCQSDKDCVWCRLLDRSQAYCQQTQPAHSACTTTTRQESANEIGCLQAETRQQEASIRQWYLNLFRCTGTPFRRCRWELDSLQRHRSLFSDGFPRTSILQTPRLVWWVWQRNPGTPWRETHTHTHTHKEKHEIPQWYQLSI